MKFLLCFLTTVIFSIITFGQSNEFEGMIVYKAGAKTKLDGISEQTILSLVGTADTVVTYIKKGNYYRKSNLFEHYYLRNDEKLYIRYKGIDTLYYIPYSQDTSAVIGVAESGERKRIVGYECKAITIKSALSSTTFYYSPLLYANPEYTKNLTLGHLNLFVQKTRSVWLENEHDDLYFQMTTWPVQVEQMQVDDQLFALPALPVIKFRGNALVKVPEFTGEEKTWGIFLQTYTRAELAAKYLKFKKGQDVVRQIVYVGFVVSPEGDAINAKVLNLKEVHPKLAAEAVEVIELSDWKPGSVLGKTTNFPLVQPIVFEVRKE